MPLAKLEGLMSDTPPIGSIYNFARRLTRTRIGTRCAMTLERLWPLVLPLVVIGSLFFSLSWLGMFRLLPDAGRVALVVALGLAAIAALYPLRFYRRPTNAEIDRRIERANALLHTPVLVQTDRLSGAPDGFSQALWQEHQRRMAERLRGVGSDLPRPRVPERDPWALRAAAALLFVVAFAFSYSPLGGNITDAFQVHLAREVVPPRIDAWVTPPGYTGKAPIFLTADGTNAEKVFTVPAGSEVSLRVTGGSGEETAGFTDAAGNEREIAAKAPANAGAPANTAANAATPAATGSSAARQFGEKLATDGTLSLEDGGQELARWTFAVTPDKAPEIRFTEEPKRAANGTLELNYEIVDDYGAAAAQGEFALADEPLPNARPLYGPPEMPLSLPRRGDQGGAARAQEPLDPLAQPSQEQQRNPGTAAKTARDLTEHVWSGANVRLTLKAKDDAGQEARSETRTFTLPERPFFNPLARALIEQRRILALDANQKGRVLKLMDAITVRPEDTFDNMAHYLAIMSAHTRLEIADTDNKLRDVVSYLWQIALGIEDGALSDAEKRLRQAQENLKQALERGASDEEIERLMKELRQAMNEFLREFAERARQNPDLAQQMPPNAEMLRESDLQRMLDQIENLAKSGAKDKAQELLSQLQDMMNNLQAMRQQPGQQGQQGQQGEMRQQMDKLGEIMRRQQEMMNETFRLDQMQRGQQQGQNGENQQQQQGQGQQGQQQGEQGQQGQQGQQGRGMTPEELAEALRQLQEGQGQLQGDLNELMKSLEGMGMQPGEGFGDADDAMGEAGKALGDAQGERAVGEQGRALEALRRGAQDMMQQMQQAMRGDQGGAEEGGRARNSDRDPLGRPPASRRGPFDETSREMLPGEIDVQRARQILDAIRKRLGNALSPQLEREYLERLLEMR